MRRRIRITEKNLTPEDIKFLLQSERRRHTKLVRNIKRKCIHDFVFEPWYKCNSKGEYKVCNYCRHIALN